jgi:DNA-binding XRE family transcriptional regulator
MDYSISFYRKLRDLKQQELADKLEISRTELSFIETKKVLPKHSLAILIAETLKVTIGQIYTKEELDFILYKTERLNESL